MCDLLPCEDRASDEKPTKLIGPHDVPHGEGHQREVPRRQGARYLLHLPSWRRDAVDGSSSSISSFLSGVGLLSCPTPEVCL